MSSRYIPKIFLAVALLCIYAATIAPGLTWANNGVDGGDLITASITGGIAHPSGYPAYLLIARLFQYIPIGSLAFRTNLMSALMAVCVTLVTYQLVSISHNWLAGLVSAFAIGLSPLFWSQAVITEVYVLHVLFVVILLFLSTLDFRGHFFFGLLFGLGAGNHITIIFLLPILFCREKEFLLKRFIGMMSGFLIYLILPLRAMSVPLVNWGNPVTLKNFIWLVSGKLYQGQLFQLTSVSLWGRIRAVAALFLEQFGSVGLLIGFMGLIIYSRPSRLNYNMLWISSVFLLFPLIYNTRDSFLYLLPCFLCFSIWIGIGLNGLLNSMYLSRWFRLTIGLFFLLVLFIRAGIHWPLVDASHDNRAENFGREMMTQIPENAIVFAKGDQAVLALWYFHYALQERPDMAIIATDLLQNEWYQDMVRVNYPALTLPDFFMFSEVIIVYNPIRTICYVEYTSSAQVRCLLP